MSFKSKKHTQGGLPEHAEGGLMIETGLVGLAVVKAWGGKWVVSVAATGYMWWSSKMESVHNPLQHNLLLSWPYFDAICIGYVMLACTVRRRIVRLSVCTERTAQN